MSDELDDLLNALPRYEVRAAFLQELKAQIPVRDLTPIKTAYCMNKILAPLAMAASLALGLWIGVADFDLLSTSLDGLGMSPDSASEWASLVDPYGATIDNL